LTQEQRTLPHARGDELELAVEAGHFVGARAAQRSASNRVSWPRRMAATRSVGERRENSAVALARLGWQGRIPGGCGGWTACRGLRGGPLQAVRELVEVDEDRRHVAAFGGQRGVHEAARIVPLAVAGGSAAAALTLGR
jgi:hypothetical protein